MPHTPCLVFVIGTRDVLLLAVPRQRRLRRVGAVLESTNWFGYGFGSAGWQFALGIEFVDRARPDEKSRLSPEYSSSSVIVSDS